MNSQQQPKSILVIDNDSSARRSLKNIFSIRGFTVYLAETKNDGIEVIKENYIDLALVDVRLEDDNLESDLSGFDCAIAITEKEPTVLVILMSAHKGSFSKTLPQNCTNFYKKSDSSKLVSLVEKKFANEILLNRELIISNRGKLTTPLLVSQIRGYEKIGKKDENDPELRTACDALMLLFRRLFLLEKEIEIEGLNSGHSGAAVVLVHPIYEHKMKGASVVVKLGQFETIKPEFDNYQKFVEPYLAMYSTHLIGELNRNRNLAGVKLMFIGAVNNGRKIEDFATLFQNKRLPNNDIIVSVLNQLFLKTCAFWYNGSQKVIGTANSIKISNAYISELRLAGKFQETSKSTNLDFTKIRQEISKLLDHDIKNLTVTKRENSQLQFEYLYYGIQKERILPNPIDFLIEYIDQFPKISCWAITHGDLNGHNIFVDRENRTWLIDFQRTGWGHALRDLAEIESVIKIGLLKTKNIGALYHFEEKILAPQTLHKPIRLSRRASSEMERAKIALNVIRLKAFDVADSPNDCTEYYASLFFYALKMIKIDNSEPIFSPAFENNKVLTSKFHALFSASLLAQFLLDNHINKSRKR